MLDTNELRDPLFKGCTRPAMLFGVPLVPLAIVSGAVVLISMYTTLFITLLLLPIIATMRLIAKEDDQQFRLLRLKSLFRFGYYFKNRHFWKASTYSPIAFKKRK